MVSVLFRSNSRFFRVCFIFYLKIKGGRGKRRRDEISETKIIKHKYILFSFSFFGLSWSSYKKDKNKPALGKREKKGGKKAGSFCLFFFFYKNRKNIRVYYFFFFVVVLFFVLIFLSLFLSLFSLSLFSFLFKSQIQ